MSLPLLALRTCDVGAPFPETTVTFRLEFTPMTNTNGPTAKLTLTDKPNNMTGSLRLVTKRLGQWVCSGIVANSGEGNLLPDGGRQWSITWKEFNQSIAGHTCTSANSPGGAQKVPYVLTKYSQSRMDDDGRQIVSFTFAVYADSLDTFLAGRR